MTEQRSCRVYAFAGFTLDARRRLLCAADGQPVPLPTASFDTLLHLVERAGDVVEKAALMRAVWPHVIVEENSLSQSISVLRRALGENPSEPKFVVTVPGRGYRFIAEVASSGADGQRAEPVMASADPDALQLFVTGWWALTRPGGGNLEDALRDLQQAIVRDPNFALAYVCIADCYTMLGVHAVRRPHDAFPKARAAVLRALEIDSNLAEGHAELGHIHACYDFDFKRAHREIDRALEINPRCFLAHRYRGIQLIARGELDAAHAAFRRAQSIQPLAVNINGNIGMVHYFAGRYDEAVAQLELTLRMDGSFDVARNFLGRSLLRLGAFERAIEQFANRAVSTFGSAADLAAVYALSGREGEARAVLAGLLESAQSRYVSPTDIATIHASLGDDDAAMDFLEQSIEQRAFDFINVNPTFRRLHGRPRFRRILEQFGLAQ